MIDTRTTVKGKYEKDKYNCHHCREGRKDGVLETPSHLLSDCTAYSDLRERVNPELVLDDGNSLRVISGAQWQQNRNSRLPARWLALSRGLVKSMLPFLYHEKYSF